MGENTCTCRGALDVAAVARGKERINRYDHSGACIAELCNPLQPRDQTIQLVLAMQREQRKLEAWLYKGNELLASGEDAEAVLSYKRALGVIPTSSPGDYPGTGGDHSRKEES